MQSISSGQRDKTGTSQWRDSQRAAPCFPAKIKIPGRTNEPEEENKEREVGKRDKRKEAESAVGVVGKCGGLAS